MHSRWVMVLGLLFVAAVLGLSGLTLWHHDRDAGDLNVLIAALPPRPPARRALSSFERHGTVTRLIEWLAEARQLGTGGSLGCRSLEMVRRDEVLKELERRATTEDRESRRRIVTALRADLDHDPGWPATVRDHRIAWLHWVARLRTAGSFEESEVLGAPEGLRKYLTGRRLDDGDLVRGWKIIERFFDRAEAVSFHRRDYPAALDALVEAPNPDADPVGAYFAVHATGDFKSSWRRMQALRRWEERLLSALEAGFR